MSVDYDQKEGYFNEQIKMSQVQNERLNKVDSKLDLYLDQMIGHHDQISRLSDAIDLYRSNQKLEQLASEKKIELRAN